MTLRSITVEDIPRIYQFWQENYKVDRRDDFEHLKIFFDKNPDLSTLAEDDGEITGTCLGSFDGRKGYIEKVVVKENLRGEGLGKRLIEETIKKLKQARALDIRVGCAQDLVPFYENLGFKDAGVAHLKIKG